MITVLQQPSASDLATLYSDRRTRYAARDRNGQRVRDVLANRMNLAFRDVISSDEEPVAPNLVIAAARSIGQRVGRYPRMETRYPRVFDELGPRKRKKNEDHEAQLANYLYKMNFPATFMQAAYWLVAHDSAAFVVRPSKELKVPVVEVKDPLTTYPGTVNPWKPEVYDCLFATRLGPQQVIALYPQAKAHLSGDRDMPSTCVLGEYYDPNGVTIALLEPKPVILDFCPAVCPGQSSVFIGRGFSDDLDFHGQFDHVIPAMIGQAKLFAMMMSYAEQGVYSETNIVGELTSNGGRYARGPSSVNLIAPAPNANVAKLTNNMSPQVFTELDRLERSIRIAGGFPAQMSGEPVATIATGKGLEQLTLTVDDNVNYWQQVLGDVTARALNYMPKVARAMMSEGWEDFSPDVAVYPRFLSAADPGETVRLLQLLQAGLISKQLIQERLPEIDNPDAVTAQGQVEQLQDVLMKSFMAKAEQGAIDPTVIAEVISRIQKGDDIEKATADAMAQAPPPDQGQGQPPMSLADVMRQAQGGGQQMMAPENNEVRAMRAGPQMAQLMQQGAG